MRISQSLPLLFSLAITASSPAAAPPRAPVSFHESFDDADLPKRGWYDGTAFRMAGDA